MLAETHCGPIWIGSYLHGPQLEPMPPGTRGLIWIGVLKGLMELEQLPGLFSHHHACQWLASVRVTSHWASSGIVVGREKVTLFQGPFIPARTENYHLQLTLSVQVSSWLHAHTFFT